jgi:hypothetical protein
MCAELRAETFVRKNRAEAVIASAQSHAENASVNTRTKGLLVVSNYS